MTFKEYMDRVEENLKLVGVLLLSRLVAVTVAYFCGPKNAELVLVYTNPPGMLIACLIILFFFNGRRWSMNQKEQSY